ncbi:T9SS type A sorting domain-containing protein [Winogradskyella sp. PC D3.3]
MKNYKPTLIFLSALCFSNLSKAQQFESGYNIQNQLQGQYEPGDQNYFDSTAYESEYKSTEAYENALNVSSENDNLERSAFDIPVTHIYNDGWVVGDPLVIGLNIADLIVVQSGTIVIDTNLTLSLITIEAGASITINSGVTVTANVLLNSTAGEFSSLISDGTIVGNVTYSRQTAIFGTNELVSAPLSGQLFSAFSLANTNLPGNPSLLTMKAFAPFVTSAGAYNNLDILGDATHVLAAGNGYRAATSDGNNLIYTGAVETGNVSGVAITNAGDGDSWNLIGNPYPSYIDFNTFYATNSSQLDPESMAIYCYTGNSSNPWRILNQLTTELAGVTELIAPGQAFFVKSKTGGGSIDFTTSMRSGGSTNIESSRDAVSSHYGHIKLNLSSGSSLYSTDFYFNSNASEGLDPGYDASLFGSNPPAFSIYSSLMDNSLEIPLAIQAFNNSSMSNVVVPLGVNAPQGQELTISIAESDMSDDTNMYLEDTVSNTVTLLNTSDFVFTPAVNLSGTGRFYLRFETNALSVINVDMEAVKIYVNNAAKTININGQLENTTEAKLFDVNGRLVLTNVLNTNNTSQSIDVSQLTSGVYIVELDNNTNERRIEKLIIR